jgi:hypothetical protein
MTYAVRTKVPVTKSKTEIEAVLVKHGAKKFAYYIEPNRASVVFEASDRRIRFDLPLPEGEQKQRERWRALLLCIKAKLESVESRIETFEEAFLAHVVMPDNTTVSEGLIPQIRIAYKDGSMPTLLPPPKRERP